MGGQLSQPFPLHHPEPVVSRPGAITCPWCICFVLSIYPDPGCNACLSMLGCDSVTLNLQGRVGPTEHNWLVPLVLSFLFFFSDHVALKRAKTALNILMDDTVYESDSFSSHRGLGQFHIWWQWLLKKLSRKILAVLKMLVQCDVDSSSHSNTSLIDAEPNSPQPLS